ncbi:MAG: XdhC/CoxI family protein [SAR324 cluster bacterium]
MHRDFHRRVGELLETRQPFVVATVIRVRGSASARPGSQALIDAQGSNVFGWVGGGCAESLVREESLKALEAGRPRIVDVDLDDEVLGVGMPCGGHMDVYLQPHFPPKPLTIVGQGALASHLAALAGLLGYAVTVHGPQARPDAFPTAVRVRAEGWDSLEAQAGAALVVCAEPGEHLAILRRAVSLSPAYLACVASPTVAAAAIERLRHEGVPEEKLAAIRVPAGLDLGGRTVEETSLSILAELLAVSRGRSGDPLRVVKGRLQEPVPSRSALEPGRSALEPGRSALGPERSALARVPAVPDATPELLVVGHGRIAEELARLAALLRWKVTVNSPAGQAGDFPAGTCLVTDDLDFSRLDIQPATFVVIATLHKGDHLSMQKALEDRATYIGLIASRKRSGLVLEYLQERGFSAARMANVHAPAGLDLGAANPTEIAVSVMSEAVAAYRGGSCRPLRDCERLPRGANCTTRGAAPHPAGATGP